MARPKVIPVRRSLARLFPAAMLQRVARESGAVVRQRKVNIVHFFWTLVLGFGSGRHRTLAGLRRAYKKATGQELEESSFYKRFSPGLVRMLKRLLSSALDEMVGIGRELNGALSSFRDLVITDSTVVRLNALLEGVYPGSRTNHSKAALKLHAVLCVRGAGKQSVRVTSGRQNDGPVFQVAPWIRGRLLLFDLGYFRYRLFDAISRNRGFFIARLKGKVDPVIVGENRVHRGRALKLIGRNQARCP